MHRHRAIPLLQRTGPRRARKNRLGAQPFFVFAFDLAAWGSSIQPLHEQFAARSARASFLLCETFGPGIQRQRLSHRLRLQKATLHPSDTLPTTAVQFSPSSECFCAARPLSLLLQQVWPMLRRPSFVGGAPLCLSLRFRRAPTVNRGSDHGRRAAGPRL